MDKQQLKVRVPPALHRALKVKAARETTTVQALVEAAIRRLLNTRKE
jgi:predicted HicB family RNase H-like nuclease